VVIAEDAGEGIEMRFFRGRLSAKGDIDRGIENRGSVANWTPTCIRSHDLLEVIRTIKSPNDFLHKQD
jgi:hypothetical protein